MHPDQPSSRPILPLVLALFFLSGALALVYQVVWARMMTHIFGSTALAVGTVLAGFMAGLALGSWVAGRIADRTANCLRLYAWLEIGIAAAAIAVHLLLDGLQSADSGIYEVLGGSAGMVALMRFLLVFLLVMAPTLLMGATLPVLASLVDKSLIVLGRDGRYSLHELLRQYAAEQLDDAGAIEATHDTHMAYYLTQLSDLAPAIKGQGQIDAERPQHQADRGGVPGQEFPGMEHEGRLVRGRGDRGEGTEERGGLGPLVGPFVQAHLGHGVDGPRQADFQGRAGGVAQEVVPRRGHGHRVPGGRQGADGVRGVPRPCRPAAAATTRYDRARQGAAAAEGARNRGASALFHGGRCPRAARAGRRPL